MIKIERQDLMSIQIEFDEQGLEQLIKVFWDSKSKGKGYVFNVDFDKAVIKMRNCKIIQTLVFVERDNGIDNGRIEMRDNMVIWKMYDEDIETGIERFNQCKKVGYFSPGEFMRIQTPKNSELDYVYCSYV